MHRFWETHIRPVLSAAEARVVCEIGVQSGAGTRALVAYVRAVGGHVHAIDPDFPPEWEDLAADFAPVGTFHRGPSLEVLPQIPPCDAYLIDGDHNYHTVSNELAAIASAVRGRPCVVLLHDVGWPYGRRDLYYAPERIPPEARQPWARRGLMPGVDELVDDGLNAHLANALHEGGPRNGVLTAVEDFVQRRDGWTLDTVPGLHGLAYLLAPGCDETVRRCVNERTTLSAAGRELIEVVESARVSEVAHVRKMLNQEHARRQSLSRSLERERRERAEVEARLRDLESRRAHRYAETARNVLRQARGLGRRWTSEQR